MVKLKFYDGVKNLLGTMLQLLLAKGFKSLGMLFAL